MFPNVKKIKFFILKIASHVLGCPSLVIAFALDVWRPNGTKEVGGKS